MTVDICTIAILMRLLRVKTDVLFSNSLAAKITAVFSMKQITGSKLKVK